MTRSASPAGCTHQRSNSYVGIREESNGRAEKGWEKTRVEELERRTVPGTRNRNSYQLDGKPITKQRLPLLCSCWCTKCAQKGGTAVEPVPTGWSGVNVRLVPRTRRARNSAACGAGSGPGSDEFCGSDSLKSTVMGK
ncbi:uncharacterized protein CLUP02_17360 [Colletotrichum lupini]|uniref:Uncharacterized protein n=1 Tax=Colletotrichum lupini TaxID=145971 RepID=A0A9Q8SF91_9PEZI|nr:uncharacterized protein CLUP02_17360 [Colletotrichum lupini]UQC75851.1 hypothetical protein CLUP02_17360 [Colletotrichum lupini]